MKPPSSRFGARAILVAAAVLAASALANSPVHAQKRARAATAAAQAPSPSSFAALHWRSIGPANMGGRTIVITGIPGDPNTFYIGGADGGLWKTTNGGTTWTPLFEDQAVLSVSAIAVAPSNHNVVWIGTGEGDPRNPSSPGDGVYLSQDAGAHWTHVGLNDSERIKRIVVDASDPMTAFVCAPGHAWGPSAERGVFRTTDGGKTWQKVLYMDENTGCSDMAMDPSNSRILFAGMWTFRRQPWHFSDGGGNTALYRSHDGGNTWQKLTGHGMPTEPMARIGVAIARSNPEIVYMVTETKTQGELFRSDDGGDSWRATTHDRQINFRPFYYSDIRVDPQDPDRVFSLSGSLYMSEDGGRNFRVISRGVHGDHQGLWIDPTNPQRILSSSDGGFQLSDDGGKNWRIMNNIALSQFYHIDYDMDQPYHVCGGLQDNGTWCGPSQTTHRDGITKADWFTVGGGDGFYAIPVPDKPWLIYTNLQGGVVSIADIRTDGDRNIVPHPKFSGSFGGAIGMAKYRFNWDSPIAIDPLDPKTVYIGAQKVLKSTDYGQSWQEVSPDLTTNDTSEQQSSGGPVYVDNTAAEFHTTIMTIAPSPVKEGVIWAGTDDGNVQVTTDGGQHWTNVIGNIKGLPPASWVSRIDASPHDAGTAFVAFDRHQMNDFKSWAYYTTDYGKTWTAIGDGLHGYVHVVRQDPKNADLLYAGTEYGVWASWDMGRHWVSIRNGLPPVAVRDIKVHPRENDLILATFGRGVYILDNATSLQQLATAESASGPTLFPVRPAVRWQISSRSAALGQAGWHAENPPYGAIIDYYVKADAPQPMTLTIKDAGGATVRVMHDSASGAGIGRTGWDLRYAPAPPIPGARRRTGGFFFGRGGGPLAVPGHYTVTMNVGGATLTQPIEVRPDPRTTMTAADFQAQFKAAVALRDLQEQIDGAIGNMNTMKRQLRNLRRDLAPSARNGGPDAALRTQAGTALDSLNALEGRDFQRPPPDMNYRQYPRLLEQTTSLMFQIDGGNGPPTDGQAGRIGEIGTDLEQSMGRLNAIVNGPIADINAKLQGRARIGAGGKKTS